MVDAGMVEYHSASSAYPPMAWAGAGLMYPSRTVVSPDSLPILLMSYVAKQLMKLNELGKKRFILGKATRLASIGLIASNVSLESSSDIDSLSIFKSRAFYKLMEEEIKPDISEIVEAGKVPLNSFVPKP